MLSWQLGNLKVIANEEEKKIFAFYLTKWNSISKRVIFIGIPEKIIKKYNLIRNTVLYDFIWVTELDKFQFENETIEGAYKKLKEIGVVLNERIGKAIFKQLFFELERLGKVFLKIADLEIIKFCQIFLETCEKFIVSRKEIKKLDPNTHLGVEDEEYFYIFSRYFDFFSSDKRHIIKALYENNILEISKKSKTKVIRIGNKTFRTYVLKKKILKKILEKVQLTKI